MLAVAFPRLPKTPVHLAFHVVEHRHITGKLNAQMLQRGAAGGEEDPGRRGDPLVELFDDASVFGGCFKLAAFDFSAASVAWVKFVGILGARSVCD